MRRLFVISASIHVVLFALLPILPNLGVRQPLAMEVYAVELVDLPSEAAPVEEVQEETVPEPEPAPVEPPPEADPIPERPVKRPVRKVIAPPPKRVEKSLEEKIADRLKAQDERHPEQKPREETPKPQTTPSSSTKITAGKVVADYYLTMLQGKITRNWAELPSTYLGDRLDVTIDFTITQ
jgi:outer membrane biosynthesis protein TonB